MDDDDDEWFPRRWATSANSRRQSDGNTNVPPRSIAEINTAHVRACDKFFRMCAGMGSELIAFHAGYIYLSVGIGKRQRDSVERMVRNISKAWRHQFELRDAVGYCSMVSTSASSFRYFCPGGPVSAEQKEAYERWKPLEDDPSVFLKIIEEQFGPDDAS